MKTFKITNRWVPEFEERTSGAYRNLSTSLSTNLEQILSDMVDGEIDNNKIMATVVNIQ